MRSAEPLTLLVTSPSPMFSGDVSTTVVAEHLPGAGDVKVGLVRFEAGACTRWHTHDGDQLLLIVDGRGWISTRTDVAEVHAGSTVVIPAGEEHYHAAADDSAMVQYSVLAGTHTEILEAVGEQP